MSVNVLIVAGEPAARTSAEVARSLQFVPVVAASEDEAVNLLETQPFSLIAVSVERASKRLRQTVQTKQPAARLLELPDPNGDDTAVRRLMLRHLRRDDEHRYRFLSTILESFTTTLDLREVMRRIVSITREEFRADRAWLVRQIDDASEFGKVILSVSAPGLDVVDDKGPVPLQNSRNLIRRAKESPRPVAVVEGDPDLDPELVTRFGVRSQLVQILRPAGEEPWAFGLHHCSSARLWSDEEIELFNEIGRYATMALNNTLMHDRAVREAAKMNAILDQIPQSAAIYDANGRLERMNAAAQRDSVIAYTPDPDGRIRGNAHRYLDGTVLSADELPSMRALRGEVVRADYLVRDARSEDDRVVNFQAAPIRDDKGRIIGSVVLSRDVTDERLNTERESWRRRRAECLANLGLEALTVQPSFDDLTEPARRVANAIIGLAQIYLYRPNTGLLDLVGWASNDPTTEPIGRYFRNHPYRPGEGLPGVVFQIGRPLLFYEIRGNAVVDYARDEEEKQVKGALHEQSLIACPIEAYGERIGALVLSQSDPRRNFDAEDLEFARAVAERIGAASHIHRLTRMSLEGHRAAEELARQEVDARMRFEAVLETAPIGIAVISADELRFELANARFLDYASHYGKVSDDDTKLVGLRGEEVIPGFERILKQVAEAPEPRIEEALEVKGPRPIYVNRIISPVRGRFSGVTQSITVLVQDVTEQVVEERQNRERETLRRRRAECLASLGLEKLTVESSFDDLDEPATRVAQAVNGSAIIYMYHPQSSELYVAGFAAIGDTAIAFEQYRDYVQRHPFHPGEGLPGTVFQIGRPLFYSDVTGEAVIDFGRTPSEKQLIAALHEESVIACAIESYGERVGALVVSRSDPRRNFTAEDLEFVQSVAERIGAASHIQRLTRISQEGHRAAEELARREVDARVRFEAVLETAPIGIAVISADELRFDLANARFMDFAARFGKITSDTKVIGLRAEEVIPGFERTLKNVAESGETRFDEAFEVGPYPDRIFVNRIISAARGRFSGITQSLTILIQDVTDQVRAKKEIEDLAKMMAERSARLDSILGSMTDGLWVFDARGAVVDVNQAALTMFGLASRSEAVQNQSFDHFELRYPDGRPIPREDLPQGRALRGMIVPDYLAIGKHALTGRDLDLSIAAAPIESNGIVGAVLVIRDITGLQELDRKKDEFLSVASHELRTPLTTIKGYTQLLSQTVNDLPPEERATYINAVLGEIDRMMGLISELLDVSRIETNRLQIHRQAIHWVDFIERRVSAFRVQNPSRLINFVTTVGDEMLLEADPDRMRQVMDNLLSNAIKYSPEGSEIDVRVAVTDGAVQTAVADRGIGIPRDEIPQLFERFHRARNVSSRYYGGLGLGLYIAKAIVEAHKGRITVESEEGTGSTFTVTLPRV